MEKRGIGNRLKARINVEPPVGDQVQKYRADVLLLIRQRKAFGDIAN